MEQSLYHIFQPLFANRMVKQDSQYNELMQQLIEAEKGLRAITTDEAKLVYEKITAITNEVGCVTEEENFELGFSLGFKIAVLAFFQEGKNFKQ